MIDEAAARIGQIDVLTARILIDPLHHSIDGRVVHIDEEDAHGRGTVFIDFDGAAQGDDPAIAIGRIQEEIFDMRGGEMQIIGLSKRLGKPALGRHIEVFLRRGDRRGRNQPAIGGKERHTDEMLEVCFIDEVHLTIDAVRAEICIFDDIIVYRIRDAAHIGEVILEIDDGLLHDLLGGFHGARPHTTCKQLIQDQPQDHEQHEGDDGEGHQNRSLDGMWEIASLPLFPVLLRLCRMLFLHYVLLYLHMVLSYTQAERCLQVFCKAPLRSSTIRQARCRPAAVPYTSTAIRRISF